MPKKVHELLFFPEVADRLDISTTNPSDHVFYRGTTRKMPNKTVDTWSDEDIQNGVAITFTHPTNYQIDIYVVFVDPDQVPSTNLTFSHSRAGKVIETATLDEMILTAHPHTTHLVTIDNIVLEQQP